MARPRTGTADGGSRRRQGVDDGGLGSTFGRCRGRGALPPLRQALGAAMLTGALLAGQAGVPTEELHLHP